MNIKQQKLHIALVDAMQEFIDKQANEGKVWIEGYACDTIAQRMAEAAFAVLMVMDEVQEWGLNEGVWEETH